MKHAFNYL